VSKVQRIAAAVGVAALAAAAVIAATATASTSNASHAAAGAQVCVLLPDTKSSVRWETQDRPRLAAAFKRLGDSATIVNALGSPATQLSQAQQCLTNGAKVLLLVNLDSGSGLAIEKLAVKNHAQVIDYDRLTLKGLSSYYVSFDNPSVGKLQGQGLINCLTASGAIKNKPVVAELNGSPTDNNATLFAQGYNSILNPKYANGTLTKGPNQSVPAWDNQKALTIFQGMLTQTNNNIQGVLAANDGLGNAVISALKSAGLKPIPVTGQDATAQGVDNILSGWQCMTVYKSIKAESAAAAAVADGILHGKPINTNGKTTNNGIRKVPSVLLTPVAITKNNWKLLISDGFLTMKDVCSGEYAKYC
jgi:D-xylose transport system substrate-binding protein